MKERKQRAKRAGKEGYTAPKDYRVFLPPGTLAILNLHPFVRVGAPVIHCANIHLYTLSGDEFTSTAERMDDADVTRFVDVNRIKSVLLRCFAEFQSFCLPRCILKYVSFFYNFSIALQFFVV